MALTSQQRNWCVLQFRKTNIVYKELNAINRALPTVNTRMTPIKTGVTGNDIKTIHKLPEQHCWTA